MAWERSGEFRELGLVVWIRNYRRGRNPAFKIRTYYLDLRKGIIDLGARRNLPFQTFFTKKYFSKVPLSPLLRHHPGPFTPGRVVTDMLPMPTFQIRHPVVIFILMKSNYFLFQFLLPVFFRLGRGGAAAPNRLFGEDCLSGASF